MVKYLSLVFQLPCFDLWEENPNFLHTYSLGAVYGGLESLQELASRLDHQPGDLNHLLTKVSDFALTYGVADGEFVKFIRVDSGNFSPVKNSGVDASLIGLCTPYNLVSSDDPVFEKTMGNIETNLVKEKGGVYRYLADTYYGGGEWVLLAGWYSWHYASIGQKDKARQLVGWIESQVDEDLLLSEQVHTNVLYPDCLPEWEKKWGKVAKPLLWSHAMYLIAATCLEKY